MSRREYKWKRSTVYSGNSREEQKQVVLLHHFSESFKKVILLHQLSPVGTAGCATTAAHIHSSCCMTRCNVVCPESDSEMFLASLDTVVWRISSNDLGHVSHLRCLQNPVVDLVNSISFCSPWMSDMCKPCVRLKLFKFCLVNRWLTLQKSKANITSCLSSYQFTWFVL